MNFNTFFLDKLSTGEQSIPSNLKKGSSVPGLFSDIVKVCEQETAAESAASATQDQSQAALVAANLFNQNVFESSGSTLKALSQFIQDFVNDSNAAVNSPDVVHNLQNAVISKKQFILSGDGLEQFLNQLVSALENSWTSEQGANINSNQLQSSPNNGQDSLKLIKFEKNLSNNAEEKSLENGDELTATPFQAYGFEGAAQAMLNYLASNKSFSFAFKNGSEKINISIHELPEENIEAKINLDKLSADFKKAVSASGGEGFNPADNYVANVSLVQTSQFGNLAANAENTMASDSHAVANSVNAYKSITDKSLVSTSSVLPQSEIYKAEVIEISSKENFAEPAAPNKTGESSGLGANNVFSQLNSFKFIKSDSSQYGQNKFYETQSFKTYPAGQDNNLLEAVNVKQAADSIEEGGMENTVKDKPLSDAISNAEAKKTLIIKQNSTVINVVDAEGKKIPQADANPAFGSNVTRTDEEQLKNLLEKIDSIPQTLFSKHSTVSGKENPQADNSVSDKTVESEQGGEFNLSSLDEFVKTASEELKKLSAEEKILKKINNTENKSASAQEIKDGKPETDKKISNSPMPKIFGEEPDASLLAAQANFKTKTDNENSKTGQQKDASRQVSSVTAGEIKEPVQGAQGKSSGDKEAAKEKSSDVFKNILQTTETVNNSADKFKNIPESKPFHETVKIIKATEIVNEFSKVIQAGEKQSLTFQLTPENLGKVKLVVDLVENQISTRIEVENENIKQFIQSNIEQLKQNLHSSGIQLNQLNISLADSEQKSAKAFSRKKQNEKISKIKEEDLEANPSKKTMGYNTYEYLA